MADLDDRLKEAVRAYEAMSPVDRALHDADQRRSFVRGQSGRDPGPDALAEEVRRLREQVARFTEALQEIAKGETPPEQHGHSLAHRQCVKIARDVLKLPQDAARAYAASVASIPTTERGR